MPTAALYSLAQWVADGWYVVGVPVRRAVQSNLRVVLGPQVSDEELARRSRRVFRNFARRIVDFLRLDTLSPAELRRSFVVEGEENLHLARRMGRGKVLFLTAHLGNWEWAGAWLGLVGELQAVVARRHRDRFVERLFRTRRAAYGLKVFEERRTASGIIGLLRSGRSLGMLADRDVTREGVPASFFGRPARVPRAHVSLALRTGAIILPGFVVCEPEGKNRLIFEEPIDPRQLGDVKSGVQACLGVLEKYIRRYPDQWLVFESMWPGAA